MPLRLSLFAIALALQIFGGSRARAEVWFAGDKYETLADAADFAVHFRKRANVTLSPEQRLPNGVSWRVLTDVRTGASMPRVTWMPDRGRLATANRFLEIAHGAAITRFEEKERLRRGDEMIWKVKGGIRPAPVERSTAEAALSYASKRFIAYVESDSSSVMLDMETSEMFEERHCRTVERSQMGYETKWDWFDLGGLFDVCDELSYSSFRAAVLLWARRAHPQLLWQGPSNRSCHQIDWQRVAVHDPMLVSFITHDGLAIRRTDPIMPGPGCHSRWPGEAPTIVPYSAVASFMQPGPLRDELMAAGR
jgi:hypothetical protein